MLNLTYWGIGNPGPDWNGDKRAGDNLYSDCVVALDADTGKLKWYFQFSPHDDSITIRCRFRCWRIWNGKGQPRKVMMWANRNGFFYVLDRTNGQFLPGKPFGKVNWANGFDEAGRPMRVSGIEPTQEGTLSLSRQSGRHQLVFAVLQPAHRLVLHSRLGQLFVGVREAGPTEYVEGRRYVGGRRRGRVVGLQGAAVNQRKEEEGYGAVRAIDPKTGEQEMGIQDARRHRCRHPDHRFGRAVFRRPRRIFLRAGCAQRRVAVEGQRGRRGGLGPISYSVGGRQYIAVSAGSSLLVYALKQ